MAQDTALALMQAHGLWLVGPMAVIEGPIVTVIAAYLAKLGYMQIFAVYAVCVLGDLIGDAMYYWIGRLGPALLPEPWLTRLGMTQARKLSLEGHFASKGGRTILFGKWTHSAGLPIMLASGAARMNFSAYMGYNLLGTLPKTALFTLVGWFIGSAYAAVDTWIWRISLGLVVGLAVVLLAIWQRRRP
ncbi:MAG: VTT domain-containing protein [Pseudomonadota bacterium]